MSSSTRAAAAVKRLYGLLSKQDVVANLRELAKQFGVAKRAGIGLGQISSKMAGSFQSQLELAKEYGIRLPEAVRKVAEEIGAHGYPEVKKLGTELGNLGGYTQLSGNVIVNAVRTSSGAVAKMLRGGFGAGVDSGLAYADSVIAKYRARLKREGIMVPLIPDDSQLRDWLRRNSGGGGGGSSYGTGQRVPDTAGAVP